MHDEPVTELVAQLGAERLQRVDRRLGLGLVGGLLGHLALLGHLRSEPRFGPMHRGSGGNGPWRRRERRRKGSEHIGTITTVTTLDAAGLPVGG